MPDKQNVWFPGRLLGGITLILGPLLWFLGILLRYLPYKIGMLTAFQLAEFEKKPFAAPGQLATFQANPTFVTSAYAVYLAGVILLCPAVVAFARIIASKRPGWACFGGLFVLLGLIARVYHAGVDHTAFALVRAEGLEFATKFIMDNYVDISYGPFLVPVSFSALALIGWPMLAVGAFLSKTFGPLRSLILAVSSFIWIGVLKESDGWVSAALFAIVLIPLGVQILRGRLPVFTKTEEKMAEG